MSKLLRSRKGVIGGVCAGLANHMKIDVSILRVLFIFGTLFTVFPFILFYIICWICIPIEDF
jgi:phage shock protein C